ncbi:HTH-type transcriptional repressor CytR [Abditibacteriota bacterium]|nr:HTH-type transcriptional repressor CytR [Abditibacteriota bacterium]
MGILCLQLTKRVNQVVMRATIRSVAEEAGVSAVTVSNVLRGLDSRASPETRARVLEAAQRLNYLPVSPPTSQNRRLDTRIVTLVPEHQNITHYDLDLYTYEGIVEGARKHGYDVLTMVRECHDRVLENDELRFVDRRSDGFIFAVSIQGKWERALDIVSEHHIPSVVCYRRDTPDGVAWVDVDNDSVMAQMVAHLAERGHKRIAYLSGPQDNFDESQRQRAWVEAMWKQGLPLRQEFVVRGTVRHYDFHPEAAATVRRLGATAVVCFNDTLALCLWDALEAQGLRVPHDVSLIGVDNRPEAVKRGLSSVAHSFSEVGRLAMDAWVELKNGADATMCSRLAPVHLVVRDSVRALSP